MVASLLVFISMTYKSLDGIGDRVRVQNKPSIVMSPKPIGTRLLGTSYSNTDYPATLRASSIQIQFQQEQIRALIFQHVLIEIQFRMDEQRGLLLDSFCHCDPHC
jgi:hypothetical protein